LVWNKAQTSIEFKAVENGLVEWDKNFHGPFVSQKTADRREHRGDMVEMLLAVCRLPGN
jgi:hypothetical protein